MKKINNYSAQYKFIQKPEKGNYNKNILTQQSYPSVQSAFGNNPKKKLSKQNQEFINKISASGFKQFHNI